MKQFLLNLGMADGSGQDVSHTRLLNVLIGLAWLVSKFWNSYQFKTPVTWDEHDFAVMGIIGCISIGKTVAENSQPTPKA